MENNNLPNKKTFGQPVVFVLPKKHSNPSIEGKYYPPFTSIPTVDEIFDEKTNTNRLIRYIPGEKTVYADDQSKDAEKRRSEIGMADGILAVETQDALKLEYMNICNYNGSNPNRRTDKDILFVEHKASEIAGEDLEKQYVIDDAKDIVRKMDIEHLAMYAKILGLDVSRTEKEIRWDMRILVEKDPKEFITLTQNSLVKKKFDIIQAIEENKLIYDRTQNAISWAGGGVIVTAPIGADAIDMLLTKITSGEDGQRLWVAIYQTLTSMPLTEVEEKFSKKIQSNFQNAGKGDDAEEIYNAAWNTKVITKDGPFYAIDGTRVGDIRKKEDLINKIKEDRIFAESLKDKASIVPD